MRVASRAGMSLRLLRALAATTVIAALSGFVSSCASSGTAGGVAAAEGSASVITLNKIDTLKSLFNHDDGHTRLILIFSPT